jgi:uncharacterized cupredoxin-like copper-binding protein
VGAGDVEFNVTNFGQDDHDLSIRGPSGQVKSVAVPAGQLRTFSVNLPAGSYTLYCSIADHEQKGMLAPLSVQ